MGQENTSRVAFWDNARGLLILSVVYGHLIESTMWSSHGLYCSFLLIYSFHMPLFVFIAGLMSRNDTSPAQLEKNLATLLAPYLVFETGYSFWEHWTRSTPELVFSYATPFWPLWFLVSLFCWRMMLPYVSRLRGGFFWLLLVSVGVCASGEARGFMWSISRTIYFFPFFYAGHLCRGKPIVEWFSRPWVRVCALLLFVGLCALPIFEIYTIRREWFFGTVNTWDLGFKTKAAALRRLGVYALSFAIGGAFLGMLPRRRLPIICGWGERSIAIYLFHSSFHFLALGRNWYRYLPHNPAAKGGIVLGVSILLCLILGSPLWSRLTRWMLRPPVDWLFRSRAEEA